MKIYYKGYNLLDYFIQPQIVKLRRKVYNAWCSENDPKLAEMLWTAYISLLDYDKEKHKNGRGIQ